MTIISRTKAVGAASFT